VSRNKPARAVTHPRVSQRGTATVPTREPCNKNQTAETRNELKASRPSVSIRRRAGSLDSARTRGSANATKRQIGILMKNTHCQPSRSATIPPPAGPNAIAPPDIEPRSAKARALSERSM